MELSEKKLELVTMAIVGSENFNSELLSLDEVRQNVVKKAGFILNSLSDESLILKYLCKVVDEVLNDLIKDLPNNEARVEITYSSQNTISLNSELEDEFEIPVVENDDEVLSAFNNTDYKGDIDDKINSLNFDEADDFDNFVDDFSKEDTITITNEAVVEKVEQIQEAESFAHNDELEKLPPEPSIELEDVSQEHLLITPDIEIQDENEEQPVFDLEKEEFPILNPETLYKDVEDPIEHKEVKTVPQEVTDKILGILIEATKKPETKDYIKIFYLKYIKKLKQVEIAKILDISEAELSEMYFAMVKYVKFNLY